MQSQTNQQIVQSKKQSKCGRESVCLTPFHLNIEIHKLHLAQKLRSTLACAKYFSLNFEWTINNNCVNINNAAGNIRSLCAVSCLLIIYIIYYLFLSWEREEVVCSVTFLWNCNKYLILMVYLWRHLLVREKSRTSPSAKKLH